MPKDGPGLLGFLGDLVKDTNKNLGEKLKRQADRFIRDDKGVVVGIREPKPGSQEEKDAFDNASGFLGTFAGVGAKTADLAKLKIAKMMENSGKSRDAIWERTGWFRSPDGKWKFEIGDDTSKVDFSSVISKTLDKHNKDADTITDASIIKSWMEDKGLNFKGAANLFKDTFKRDPKGDARFLTEMYGKEELNKLAKSYDKAPRTFKGEIKDVLQHDELLKAYPKVGKTQTAAVDDLGPFVQGSFEPTEGIKIANQIRGNPETVRTTTLHETQHLIQEIEGFAKGGSPQTREWAKIEVAEVRKQIKDVSDKLTQEAVGSPKYLQMVEKLKELKEDLKFVRETIKDPGEAYMRLAGEAEARAVEARATMNAEDRAAIPPWESYDREWRNLIVRRNQHGR